MYDQKKWLARGLSRTDMSAFVTHLTRAVRRVGEEQSAVEVLATIIRERRLDGGSGSIAGKRRAVCFQDAPIPSLAQTVQYERDHPDSTGWIRYSGNGISFPKPYAFAKGARPVIYDPNGHKTFGAEFMAEHAWRVVSHTLSNVSDFTDWTHEREWRCPDDFPFELSEASILLENAGAYRAFLDLVPIDDVKTLRGIHVLRGSHL